MTLIVETGAGLANSDSYVSAADCETYATSLGFAFSAADAGAEPALRRATAYIDSYRARFPGIRTFRRAQALEWPRIGAYYILQNSGINDDFYYSGIYSPYVNIPFGAYIAPNAIPPEIIKATCQAAIRELVMPNVMMPDVSYGGILKKITAGGSSKEYASKYGKATTTFLAIDDLLSDLLTTTGSFGIAVRG